MTGGEGFSLIRNRGYPESQTNRGYPESQTSDLAEVEVELITPELRQVEVLDPRPALNPRSALDPRPTTTPLGQWLESIQHRLPPQEEEDLPSAEKREQDERINDLVSPDVNMETA